MADTNASSANLTLDQLPYLGPSRMTTLRQRGITTVEQLSALSDEEIAEIGFMGMANAARIRHVLNGGTHTPVPRQRRSRAKPAASSEPAPSGGSATGTRSGRTTRRTRGSGPPAASRTSRARRRATGSEPDSETMPVRSALSPGTRTAKTPSAPPGDDAQFDTQDILDYAAALRARVVQMPAAMDSLTEAIRQQAVSDRLYRQLTRLLAVIETVAESHADLTPKRQRRVVLLINRVQETVEDATERQRFSRKEQDDLADALRVRRRRLERLITSA